MPFHTIPRSAFSGKWLIRYSPQEFSVPELLRAALRVDEELRRHAVPRERIWLEVRKNAKKNSMFLKPGECIVRLGDMTGPFSEDFLPLPDWAKSWPAFPLQKVSLYFPRLSGDERFVRMGVPPAHWLLGSALSGHAFTVHLHLLSLAQDTPTSCADDLAGFTLFEDMLAEFREFIARFRDQYTGLIAAGGPFVTMAPVHAALHFPQINLFVRGEAEMTLPGILHALSAPGSDELFRYGGYLFHAHGWMVIADFHLPQRPHDFSGLDFRWDFASCAEMAQGLEINLLRGCRRHCVFCSQVQGQTLRRLPLEKVEQLLTSYETRLGECGPEGPFSRTVNINDDDILQDLDYAAAVFQVLKRRGFRIWGVQSSSQSFFTSAGAIRERPLQLLADRQLFVADQPLVWLGSDAFLKQRGRRLQKFIPARKQFVRLLQRFEKERIRNYHYWISTDPDSTWSEFLQEVFLIWRCAQRFSFFGFLPHAPFLVVYPSAPAFRLLQRRGWNERLIPQRALHSVASLYDYPLPGQARTKQTMLNELLSQQGPDAFLRHLQERNWREVFLALYQALRREQLLQEKLVSRRQRQQWCRCQSRLEAVLALLT